MESSPMIVDDDGDDDNGNDDDDNDNNYNCNYHNDNIDHDDHIADGTIAERTWEIESINTVIGYIVQDYLFLVTLYSFEFLPHYPTI